MTGRHVDAMRYLRFRLDLTRLLAVFALTLFAGCAEAAPEAKLWERWTAHDPASRAVIGHAPWDRFLKSYLVVVGDGVNRLAYRRVSAADQAALSDYIAKLAGTPISAHNRAEQRAYWINLYNALTVRLMLERYPVQSILYVNISPGWFSIGPWGRKLVRIEGEDVSLDDIEHRILRPIWRDPRIHYAVNCASIGCPNLQAKAFTGGNTEAMLTAGARDYVNHWRGVSFERGELFVSSIYKWFRADFGGGDAGVFDHLRRYASPELARKLKAHDMIGGHIYNWSLNDAGPSS